MGTRKSAHGNSPKLFGLEEMDLLHRLRHARKSVAKLRARFVPSRGQFSLAFRHFSPILGQFCERGEEGIMQPIELGITG